MSRNRELILWVLNVVLAAGVGLGVAEVAKERLATEYFYNELSLAAGQSQSLEQLKQVWETSASDRRQIESYFVSNDSLPQLVEQLEGLANASGVVLGLTNALVETGAEPAVRLQFNAAGDFGRLFYFLALLDNLPALMEINQLTLSASPVASGTEAAGWTGEFNVRLLSFLPAPS